MDATSSHNGMSQIPLDRVIEAVRDAADVEVHGVGGFPPRSVALFAPDHSGLQPLPACSLAGNRPNSWSMRSNAAARSASRIHRRCGALPLTVVKTPRSRRDSCDPMARSAGVAASNGALAGVGLVGADALGAERCGWRTTCCRARTSGRKNRRSHPNKYYAKEET